jgi:sigma-B regulation protein RsbU (phosphoserine phosphatase)
MRRTRLVAGAVAVGFAAAAYLIANGLELLAVQFISPSLRDVVELSDFLLSGAAGATLFLWLHLKSTRSELHRLERAQIVVNTQLATAAQIQRRLLPTQPATVEGIKCAVRFESAWDIGGDFYDFIPLGQDRMLITVGDISGKGIPAAMLLAFTRTVLRTGATRTTDPAQLLALLSNALYQDNGGTPYVTCIVAVVDARQGTVTYANAGHPPAIIAGASIRPLDTAGPPAGMFDRAVYTSDTRTLNPDDLTILVTDGISEALGENGRSIMTLIAKAWPVAQPSAVCDAIMSTARSANGPSGVEDWTDDRTVVVFQWEGVKRAREGSEQHGDVDNDVRARVVNDRVPADHAA